MIIKSQIVLIHLEDRNCLFTNFKKYICKNYLNEKKSFTDTIFREKYILERDRVHLAGKHKSIKSVYI